MNSEIGESSDNEVTVNNTTVNNTTVNNIVGLSSQSSIDKLTMELMMNKSHYKKYLLNRDPQKYQEVQEHTNKIRKYSNQLESLFAELLTDSMKSNVPEKHTRAVNDSFQEYIKTCIQHFEIKDLEQGSTTEALDTDVMFDPSTINHTISNTVTTSSWGAPITRDRSTIHDKSTNKTSHYTMDMYMNKKS
jgi:hypothetical protein